jgi:hypothetical protein
MREITIGISIQICYTMPLILLATELILQILHHVNPYDLISLRTSSKRLFKIIKQHEHVICRAIAISEDVEKAFQVPSKAQSALNTRPLQELRDLVRQWNRHRLVEQLLPVIQSHDQAAKKWPQVARRSLEMLWDYHNALRVESQDRVVEGHRSFVRSVTLEELRSLTTTIRGCGDILLKVFESERSRSLRLEWLGEPRTGATGCRRVNPLADDLVIVKGLDFLVKAVVERSPEALDEVQDWPKSEAEPVMSRLYREQLWKEKLAMIGMNDNGSGR